MPDDLTPEQAAQVAVELRGADALKTLKEEIWQAVRNREAQINLIQGELKAYKTVLRIINAINTQGAAPPTEPSAPLPPAAPPELSPEVKERIAAGKCSFKAKKSAGGKWCQRKLKTKIERSCGYCEIHMNALGIDSKTVEVTK